MYISIHVPKTAGTTIGMILDYGTDRRVLWDYSADYSTADRMQPELVGQEAFISSWFKCIHGHFFYTKWAKVFPNAKFITCLRHPVDRIVSQFRHDLTEALNGRKSWLHDPLREGRMNVVDYVRTAKSIANAHVVHLTGRAIKDYDFIFLQGAFDESINAFCRYFNFSRRDPFSGALPRVNAANSRAFASGDLVAKFNRLAAVTDSQKQAVFGAIPNEIELYQQGVEVARARISAINAK